MMPTGEPRNLVEVLGRLRDDIPEELHPEKRRFVRYSMRQSALLEPLNPLDSRRDPLIVNIREMSLGGVGFISHEVIPVDTHWRFRFIDEKLFTGSQPAYICYCGKVQDGLYQVGAQFTIEPNMLRILGVPAEAFLQERYLQPEGTDYSDFVSPEELD